MTTTAQEALKAFEQVDILTADPASWTATQAGNVVKQWFTLKKAAQKEINANIAEAEAAQALANEAFRTKAINYLTARGFACDNSLADWQKLYNHPKYFGANWNTQAVYQKSVADAKEAEQAGEGLNWFLQTAYNIWLETRG